MQVQKKISLILNVKKVIHLFLSTVMTVQKNILTYGADTTIPTYVRSADTISVSTI